MKNLEKIISSQLQLWKDALSIGYGIAGDIHIEAIYFRLIEQLQDKCELDILVYPGYELYGGGSEFQYCTDSFRYQATQKLWNEQSPKLNYYDNYLGGEQRYFHIDHALGDSSEPLGFTTLLFAEDLFEKLATPLLDHLAKMFVEKSEQEAFSNFWVYMPS